MGSMPRSPQCDLKREQWKANAVAVGIVLSVCSMRRGVEMMYILKFYLPRFQNESFEEKLTTIFHELWHISGDFNGDIRRHAGRCYVHTSSERSTIGKCFNLPESGCKWSRTRICSNSYVLIFLSCNAGLAELLSQNSSAKVNSVTTGRLSLIFSKSSADNKKALCSEQRAFQWVCC